MLIFKTNSEEQPASLAGCGPDGNAASWSQESEPKWRMVSCKTVHHGEQFTGGIFEQAHELVAGIGRQKK